MKITRHSTTVIIALVVILFPLIGYGATMTFTPDKTEVSVGEMVEVPVLVDTQGETINAIEGDIIFPASLFSLERIETGSSVVTMWVDKPSLSTSGTVYFSGAIFNGFDGVRSSQYDGLRPGVVMRLILQAKQQGSGVFSTRNTKAYLHDGRGTEIDVNSQPTLIRVVDKETQTPQNQQPAQDQTENEQESTDEEPEEESITASSSATYALDQDTTPPEPFSVEVVRYPDLYNGQYVLIFNAQDTGTGIDHYEVKEVAEKFSIASVAQQDIWKPAQNPHILDDQSLTKRIIVKAVDKAGNEQVVQLPPENDIPWYRNYIALLLAILVVIFALTSLAQARNH